MVFPDQPTELFDGGVCGSLEIDVHQFVRVQGKQLIKKRYSVAVCLDDGCFSYGSEGLNLRLKGRQFVCPELFDHTVYASGPVKISVMVYYQLVVQSLADIQLEHVRNVCCFAEKL